MSRFLSVLTALFIMFSASALALPSLSGGPAASIQVSGDADETGLVIDVRRVLLNWQIYINKQIPKHMNALRDSPTWVVVAFSSFVAFMYGVIHTLGPGHGKMVVASYLLSRDSSVMRGCFIGVKVALAHVGMAVVIVLFADFAMGQLLMNPDEKLFALKLFSFAVIVLVGIFMACIALRKIFRGEVVHYCSVCNATHGAVHDHKHISIKPVQTSLDAVKFRAPLIGASFQLATPSEDIVTEPKAENYQDSILSFAVGMVPCTGSLLILLYAMANDMLWWGVMMVVCVAVGMAAMMICIGLLCYVGRKALVDKYLNKKDAIGRVRLGGVIELVGASAIVLIGCLFISALML